MAPQGFVVEEVFLSHSEEERRGNLQRLMEQYIRDALQQPDPPAPCPGAGQPQGRDVP